MSAQERNPQAHTILLCRHGQRIEWVDRQWYKNGGDRYDPHLSAQGIVQAKLLGRTLKREPIDMIFASPYLRAVETAHYIAEKVHKPICLENGLGEWSSQELFPDGMPTLPTPTERAVTFSSIDVHYHAHFQSTYPEDRSMVQKRLKIVITYLTEQFAGTLLIVGHGITVTETAAALTDLPEKAFHADVGCLTKIVYIDGRWKVLVDGDTSHYTRFS